MISFLIKYALVIMLFPVIVFWFKVRLFKWIRDSKQKHDKELKELQARENSHSSRTSLNTEPELYNIARGKFNALLKSGQITRHEIFYLRNLINKCLGDNILEHYKNFKFQSEAHEIYIKLKSQYLEKCNFIEIISYLEECERITKEGIV